LTRAAGTGGSRPSRARSVAPARDGSPTGLPDWAAASSASDVFPTLLDLWGSEALHAPDGTSLLPALTGAGPAGRDWALWEFDFRHALPAALRMQMQLDPRACHLTVLRTAAAQYVHSPAFAPVLFAHDAPDPTADCARTMPALRAAMAEALLDRLTQLRDDTLAGRPLAGR
jgi:arylsulfatase A-like enzyme